MDRADKLTTFMFPFSRIWEPQPVQACTEIAFPYM